VKHLKFAGALAIAFVLGGATTVMLDLPRPAAAVPVTAISISPEDMTRNVGALPATHVHDMSFVFSDPN
jgi:hypothetical protein